MFFEQVKENGDNFSYIIADDATKEAAVVDPSFNVNRIMKIVKQKRLSVKYVIDTHGHGDHTAGNNELKKGFGAKIVAHRLSSIRTDLSVEDGNVIKIGKLPIKIIHTPGHTKDSICLLVDDHILLTGDTLFVGECGRTDLPGGSPEDMYNSLFRRLIKLDDSVLVYPGHDYGRTPSSTIGNEKRTNYILEPRSLEEFTEFVSSP